MITRNETRKIFVGDVQIGGQNKVVIQSMTNTKTKDVKSTVEQILKLEEAGCEIIRVACLDEEDAKAIKEIKSKIHIPIVSDIHFDYRIALEAAKAGVDKIRINPGNIGSIDRVKAVVDACKERKIPIRIGVNSGSLPKDILQEANVEINDMLEVKVSDGMIMLFKTFRHQKLEERAEKFGGKLNLDGEYEWDKPEGREVW